jgi:hypothetical protein
VSVAVEVEMPAREREAWLEAQHAVRVCNGDGSRCLSIAPSSRCSQTQSLCHPLLRGQPGLGVPKGGCTLMHPLK